jgi:enoyl-CoA hydratase/carnithine racemase
MADTKAELAQYETDKNIATIRFNRPEKMNAFSDEMVIAVQEALRRADVDDDIHAIILTGNGRCYTSGADVQQRQLRTPEEFKRLGGPQAPNANAGELLTKSVNWKPVISAAHGYVLGLGIGILLQSDLIVCEEGTKIQVTEIPRGLDGAKYWGMLHFRGAGAFANEVTLTGRMFTAEEALAHNLIDRVAPKGQHVEVAKDLARQVNRNPPLSIRGAVRTRRWYMDQFIREVIMMNAPYKYHLTEDFKEAARAFVEKRPPAPFKGR